MLRKLLRKGLPKLYDEEDLKAMEIHISAVFGDYENMAHDTVSPDVRVDICVIDPVPGRNHYTLVTIGMGAHRMRVPRELSKRRLERAEVLIALPPDWDVWNSDERWNWPLRCLETVARLPIRQNTWVGHGHTVENGRPFADNTRLSGVMLTSPHSFGNEAAVCRLPSGDDVNFYQVLPLYDEEMGFKIEKGAEALTAMFPQDFDMVVDVVRENVVANRR